jgi:hypothetical protein
MTNIRYNLSLSPKYIDVIVKIKTNTYTKMTGTIKVPIIRLHSITDYNIHKQFIKL